MSEVRVKVNPVYIPYFNNKARYLNLYGGAGSGKSVFASQKILTRIASEKGHRILCVRKVAKTLRGSIFQLLKDQISAFGLSNAFTVHKTEMRFTHSNGNEILLVGLDDVERLKSITGITGIWIEEATELSKGDYDQLDLRIRGETPHYKQIIFSYNPIDERHWLKKEFHEEQNDSVAVLRTTFRDNYFIDDEYRGMMERKALNSPNLYRIYFLGEWGREEPERPYFFNFNKERTVTKDAIYNPALPVYISIDFNVEPFGCICAHIWNDGKGMHYHIFKELVIEKNGDVYKMLDLIEGTFDVSALSRAIFTGDAMQRKREITQRDNLDAWRMIDARLKLGRRLMVTKGNPSVKDNRHLVNAIAAFHPDFKINPECGHLIYDLQFVEATQEGDIVKKDRSNIAQRCDFGDMFRYQCNTHLRDFFERVRLPKQ